MQLPKRRLHSYISAALERHLSFEKFTKSVERGTMLDQIKNSVQQELWKEWVRYQL